MLTISKVFTILCLLCLCENRKYPGSFQNKSVSSSFKWVSKYILFLDKMKGEGRHLWSRQGYICTSNHMFGKMIWGKLPECIYESFEIVRVERGQFQNFQKSRGWLIPKSPEPNMWLLVNHTEPRNTLYWN